MKIETFFDEGTFTFTYVLIDEETNLAAVIDPVLNLDVPSGKISTKSIDNIIKYLNTNDLKLEWILETHAHADHLTGAQVLKERLGGKVAIGEHINQVINYWLPVFNHPRQNMDFDRLLKDGEAIQLGGLTIHIMHTPGHTPACVSYLVEDCAFIGDTIFMPHLGTARADFPGGSAEMLYTSIQKILSLPEATKLYVGHDYPTEDKKPQYLSTVKEQQETNVMINTSVSKEEYLTKRQQRDKSLPVPKLLLPSLQVNIHAGKLPHAEDNHIQYIKIPLNQL